MTPTGGEQGKGGGGTVAPNDPSVVTQRKYRQ